MNTMGTLSVPFFFFIDFEKKNPIIIPLDAIPPTISYLSKRHSINSSLSKALPSNWYFEKYPISYEGYKKGYDIVAANLAYGNSFLTNYTCRTPIKSDLSLSHIFEITTAKYKLLIEDKLTIFSPETFVTIENGIISSYPMKGTIDADVPDAEATLLNDQKELAEHYTIVDLIRNDLSQVSTEVEVTKFRYVDKITSRGKNLLQVSSEIKGKLDDNYASQIGSILDKLLPAGSISGAPKTKTLSIIQKAEAQSRGWYTGVFGIFDGMNLESAVAIRYIEKDTDGDLVYCSGGGITHQSDPFAEYREMIDKIYLPTHSINLNPTETKVTQSHG